MKKLILINILLSTVLVSTIVAGAYLSYFHARSDDNEGNIVLSWQSSQEINVKHYVIERKTINGSFFEIGTVEALGDNSVYTFIDENAYKTTDAIFVYRLKIVDKNGDQAYSWEVTVSYSPSPVKRTWGSIKALFR